MRRREFLAGSAAVIGGLAFCHGDAGAMPIREFIVLLSPPLPRLPAGYAYLVDSNGAYLVDASGAYLYGAIS